MTSEAKKSPYYHFYKQESGEASQWFVWNGFHDGMVITDVAEEARAGREETALVDITGLQKLKVTGPDAATFLDTLFIRSVSGMKHDRVAYVAMTNEEGYITEDATVQRYSDEEFMLTSGYSLYQHLAHLVEGFDAQVTDVSEDYGAVAIYGKKSYSVLKHMGIEGLEHLKAFQLGRFQYAGDDIIISRTGFSGDLGYEIWASFDTSEKIGQGIINARDRYAITFAALTSIDTLRMEAGYIIPGYDFELPSPDGAPENYRTPFDMGLCWMVQLDRDDFIGKESLIAEMERGSRWKLASVVLETAENLGYGALYGLWIFNEAGEMVGKVGGGTYSPNMGKNIGVVNVKPDVAKGSRVFIGDDKLPAIVQEVPLFNTERRTDTPPCFYES